MSAPADVGTGALAAATVMALSFGGVDLWHLGMGTACYVVGATCRAGLKIGAATEAGQKGIIGRSVIVLSISPMLGAFASLVTFLGAHVVGFEGDAAIALALALGGFRGAEGIQAIVVAFSKLVPAKLGGPSEEPKP